MDLQQSILVAMDSLPPKATIAQIDQAAGRRVQVADLKPLLRSGHVVEVERKEPPIRGFTLTPLGRIEVGLIRENSTETTMPAQVTREQLLKACRSGKSTGWMRANFNCGEVGLEALIEEYGIWEEIAEAGQASQAQQTQTAKTEEGPKLPEKKGIDQAALYAAFASGRIIDYAEKKTLAEEFGVDPGTISYHHKRWINAGSPGFDKNFMPAEPIAPTVSMNTQVNEFVPEQVFTIKMISANLCDTCVKSDVCPFVDRSGTIEALNTDQEHLRKMRVIRGPRPVVECSAYVEAIAG